MNLSPYIKQFLKKYPLQITIGLFVIMFASGIWSFYDFFYREKSDTMAKRMEMINSKSSQSYGNLFSKYNEIQLIENNVKGLLNKPFLTAYDSLMLQEYIQKIKHIQSEMTK